MTAQLYWTDAALRDLRRLDMITHERVIAAMTRFVETGHGDVKRLRGNPVEFRLRVGNVRVRFSYEIEAVQESNTATSIFVIHRVLPRDRAYRD